jgi:hypothetical protein
MVKLRMFNTYVETGLRLVSIFLKSVLKLFTINLRRINIAIKLVTIIGQISLKSIFFTNIIL